MYHAHIRGTHYEAGYRWGSLLRKHKNIITEHIPFEITQERMDYAAACLPVYEEHYPEILEEIRGIADGQRCDVSILQAVLFSMYAMPPGCRCSCFAFSEGGEIILGRNSDFLTELEKQNLNVICRLTDGAFFFTGNTTAFVEMEDGVNEHGLAVGLTSVWPLRPGPGLNAGLLVRYLLEKCRTVSEALSALRRLPAASAHTLTLADASGEIALAECTPERTETAASLSDSHSVVCAVNSFHLAEMTGFNSSGVDDWFAETRFQTMVSAFRDPENFRPAAARKLLSGGLGFLCQYDRSTGKDTVWSVVYDLKRHRIERSEGNPGRRGFREDSRFRF